MKNGPTLFLFSNLAKLVPIFDGECLLYDLLKCMYLCYEPCV